MIFDVLHLLAAGAWLGALWPLGMTISVPHTRNVTTREIGILLVRFSWMGQAAVVVLLLSGLANSWFLVGFFHNLFASAYGRVLCAKIALFLAMLVLATANHFWITPQFTHSSSFLDGNVWLRRLRRHVFAEQALGMAVLAVVSVLGLPSLSDKTPLDAFQTADARPAP